MPSLSPPHARDRRRGDPLRRQRLYEKTRLLQLTKADGRVIRKLPIAEDEPQPGDTLNIVFDVFTGNHAKHSRKLIGGDHLRCEFVTAGAPNRVLSSNEVKAAPPSSLAHNDIDVVVRITRKHRGG
jgi:hypothetical protein